MTGRAGAHTIKRHEKRGNRPMTLDMLRCALRGVAAYRHIVEETLLQRVL